MLCVAKDKGLGPSGPPTGVAGPNRLCCVVVVVVVVVVETLSLKMNGDISAPWSPTSAACAARGCRVLQKCDWCRGDVAVDSTRDL